MGQIDIIQKILNGGNKVPDYRFNFGKHHGDSLEYVKNHDEKYLFWLVNNVDDDFLPKKVESFLMENYMGKMQ